MMKITVAGAGAGKTTTMAETIIELHRRLNSKRIIYCITFTNNATRCIEEKLINYYGIIPSNIIISTIHSFLFREIIKPYYYILYGKEYEKISICKLPDNPKYKNSYIGKLEDRNILHQTMIPERAKWVVVKKSGDRKLINEKRTIIHQNLLKYIETICIDEAQDIDNNMFEIINSINNVGINMILMGDPKQDLKGNYCFRKLIDFYPNLVNYEIRCYRCPQKHLKLSNLYVCDEEKQYSEKLTGEVNYYFASDISCKELINNNLFDLLYISQKQSGYDTHIMSKTNDIRESIAEELERLYQNKLQHLSKIKIASLSYYKAGKLISYYYEYNDKEKAMSKTFQSERIEKTSYARIINLLPEINHCGLNDTIFVNSIDIIKGMEGKNCLFILTTDLAAYLFGEKRDDNKVKNKLYVALTRSLDKLTIYIDDKVEQKYGKCYINDFFSKNISEN